MPKVEQCPVGTILIDAMAMAAEAVKWLRQFLQKESNRARLGYGLAITGHVIVALLLMLGAFERIDPASAVAVVAMPVDIVMEKPDAPAEKPSAQDSPSPPEAANAQNRAPDVPPPPPPAVADADKRAKAKLATVDVNGIDRPKQPGHDGADRSSDLAGTPLPSVDSELTSGAVSIYRDMVVAPLGLALQQTTAREAGQDDVTAVKEEKLECGRKARGPYPKTRVRTQARVIGIATAAQAAEMTKSSQFETDRRINPNYKTSQSVFVETLDGKEGPVVLPSGLSVNVGDVIEVDLGHIDPSNPCQFIPNVAVSRR